MSFYFPSPAPTFSAVSTGTITVSSRLTLPTIDPLHPPPATPAGSIAYAPTVDTIYYSNGVGWFPVAGGTPGTTESYSFVKSGSQSITPSATTVISGWTISGSPVYHTLPGWDLTNGIYTAITSEVLTMNVNIAWASGISNLGTRTVKIQYKAFATFVWTTVKSSSTQADPAIGVETTQECQMNMNLAQGDQLRVVVEHNAPVPLTISTGSNTSLSGLRVIV